MSEYDVAKVRAHFPSLESGLAFFDGPGGSQTPDVVAEAVRATLAGPLSNRGDLTVAQENAERAVSGARAALADLLGAAPGPDLTALAAQAGGDPLLLSELLVGLPPMPTGVVGRGPVLDNLRRALLEHADASGRSAGLTRVP